MPLTREQLEKLPNKTKVLLKKSNICTKVKNVIMIKEDHYTNTIIFKPLNGHCKEVCSNSHCEMSLSSIKDGENTFESFMNRNGANK